MKIKLKNFRCYLDKEFDFGKDGLLLLSGSSGCGKSTIMMAIMFAMYGQGTKIISFGKTTCEVCLEFENLKIQRTNRPNRLVVLDTITNISFEDESGQSIIDKKFGINFEITSYIKQNALKSFIVMSPTEKLEFLEKFAFQGVDLSQIKTRCLSIIKSRNEELISITSQLETIESIFKEIKKPEKVSFPILTNDKEKAIKNQNIKFKNSKILITRSERNIAKTKEELTDIKIFNTQIKAKQEIISSLTEKLLTIINEKNNINYEGDEKLQSYETSLKTFLSQKQINILEDKYIIDKDKLELLKQKEIEEQVKNLNNIKNVLWKEYTLEDIDKNITEYKEIKENIEKNDRLKKRLDENKVNTKSLENDKIKLKNFQSNLETKRELFNKLLLQKNIYQCPSCQTSLRFHENKLHVSSEKCFEKEINIEDIKREIFDLEKNINNLTFSSQENELKINIYNQTLKELNSIQNLYEEELPTLDETNSTIEYLTEYKRSQLDLEKQKKKLEISLKEEKYSQTIQLMKDQLIKQKEEIKKLEKDLKEKKLENVNEEELRDIIQRERKNKEKLNESEKQIKNLNKELKLVQDSFINITNEFNNKYNSIRDEETIINELKNFETELEKNKTELKKNNEILLKIEQYTKYKEELVKYKEWESKLQTIKKKEEHAKQLYSASLRLKEKILEAESISIQNIINSINIHAQEYLELFFPDNPIVVRLLPFKTTKNNVNKPQINLEVDYKGMEADLTMLSGGEIARVIISFTLALAEIFNSPFLMLDESTASLDQETTSLVMEGIKKNFSNKLVIIIAHQVISGDFERQILL